MVLHFSWSLSFTACPADDLHDLHSYIVAIICRITLIIVTSDDSASDLHLNRLLEFVFNSMVSIMFKSG